MERERELTVKVGGFFEITLESNRTTGYRWETEFDHTLLELSATRYNMVSAQPGSRGIEHFTFLARKNGKTLIRMRYLRPWEHKIAKEVVYAVSIIG